MDLSITDVPYPQFSSPQPFCVFQGQPKKEAGDTWRCDPYFSCECYTEDDFPVRNPELFNRAIDELREQGSTNVLPLAATRVFARAKYFSQVSPAVKTRVCSFDRQCKNQLNCAFAHTGELMKIYKENRWCIVTSKQAQQSAEIYRAKGLKNRSRKFQSRSFP
jgi:hypothetical protein